MENGGIAHQGSGGVLSKEKSWISDALHPAREKILTRGSPGRPKCQVFDQLDIFVSKSLLVFGR